MKKQPSYRFEASYQTASPILTDELVGISRVLLRGQKKLSVLTVYDTPDERLQRAGVQLVHRVKAGGAAWVLRAPGWQPWLAKEQIADTEDGSDLPVEIADAVACFRGDKVLGPTVTWRSVRNTYRLYGVGADEFGPSEQLLGRLIDESVTIAHGSGVRSRYREITFRPSADMTPAQHSFVISRLVAVGCVQVDKFRSAYERVAEIAPAAHSSKGPGSEATIEQYIAWVMGEYIAEIYRQQLGGGDDTARLAAVLHGISAQVKVLSPIVANWKDIVEALNRVCDPTSLNKAVNVLVVASRAPQISGSPTAKAKSVLKKTVATLIEQVLDSVDRLPGDEPNGWRGDIVASQCWSDAWRCCRQLTSFVGAAKTGLGKVKGLEAKAASLERKLAACLLDIDPLEMLEQCAPGEAFALGMEFQRKLVPVRAARAKFRKGWQKQRARLALEVSGEKPELLAQKEERDD